MEKKNSQYYDHLQKNKEQVKAAGWDYTKEGNLRTKNPTLFRTNKKV